jgi:hypothetical protein
MTVASNADRHAPADSKKFISREELEAISHFHDEGGHAVSFYFKAAPETEGDLNLLAMNDKVCQLISRDFDGGHIDAGLIRDLNHCLKVAEQNLELVSPLKVVFACHKRGVWLEYDLPVSSHILRLEAGTHFNVAPLFRLTQTQDADVPASFALSR